MSTREDVLDRFVAYVRFGNGCWVWFGQVMRDGYGRLSVDGKKRMAHRVAYEMMVGQIPDGLVIDHLCRNRACVNPDHLEPVTMRINLLRGMGPSAFAALRSRCPSGHEYDGENLYVTPQGHRHCKACRRISVKAVYDRKKQVATAY